jgi:hypothetical protein
LRMYLYRHRVRGKLGAATLVWINPRRVQFHCGSNQPYSNKMKQVLHRLEQQLPVLRSSTRFLSTAAYSLEPFSIAARLLRQMTPMEENETYRKVADAFACREDLRQSVWYGELIAELKRDGVASHKVLRFHSEAEIGAFFESYVGGLIDSMASGGYDATKAQDTGTGIIGADGSILKSDAGNHRFCVARLLGVPLVPLEILGAHEDWMRAMGIRGDLDRLENGLRQVEAQNR